MLKQKLKANTILHWMDFILKKLYWKVSWRRSEICRHKLLGMELFYYTELLFFQSQLFRSLFLLSFSDVSAALSWIHRPDSLYCHSTSQFFSLTDFGRSLVLTHSTLSGNTQVCDSMINLSFITFIYFINKLQHLLTLLINNLINFLSIFYIILPHTRTHTGYKIMPAPTCLPFAPLARAAHLKRAQFLEHQIWVTQFNQEEKYPG